MITITRTHPGNPDFIELVKQLDAFLAEIDGEEHAFYNQLNKTPDIKYVVMAYQNGNPAACGAMREYAPGIMEVKRMYTLPQYRGKGIATMILAELEKWAKELSCKKCILETSKLQPEAIRLYEKSGYSLIPNYGKYIRIENSVCFEKEMK